MTDEPKFTVIVPAHNEQTVIRRCLSGILQDAPTSHAMEIIVAANGCDDDTVEIARKTAPQAIVLDLSRGSKTAAINAANQVATHFPRIVLDADVTCSYGTLLALAHALNANGVMTASPAITLDLDGSDRFIRAYYRMWMRQPYAQAGAGGAGCYGLSRTALQQVGAFPDIIGDDIWIHTRFAEEQKRYLEQDRDGNPVFTIVRPPRTACEQIRVEARRQLGNKQVLANYPSPHELRSGGSGGLKSAVNNASNLFDVSVFLGIKLLARLLAGWNTVTGNDPIWTRDQSSRQA